MYDKEILDDANVKTAVRLNQDRITKADNAICQAEGEKKTALHNIFMLNSYTKIIAPYIKQAMHGTKATDVDIAINGNYFDVVFYIFGTELRTRIVAETNNEKRTARYFLSTAWTYYADIDETAPAVTDKRTNLEPLPEPEKFIERISEIAEESVEERHGEKEAEETVPAATQRPASPVSVENEANDKTIVVPPSNASNASDDVVIVDDDEDEPVFND